MKKTALLATLTFMSAAYGYEAKITKGQLPATVEAMIEKANADTQANFKVEDFYLIETRELATSKFTMYVQHSQQIPVSQTAIRIWSDKNTNELILAEMHLSESTKLNHKMLAQKYTKGKFSPAAIKSKQLATSINNVVKAIVAEHETDNEIHGIKTKDQWVNGDLRREVEVRGRRGLHHISISLLKNEVVEKSYMEFPQSENFTTLKANVFPIYEEVENTGEKLPYEVKELKYISTQVVDGGENPLSVFDSIKFEEDRYHPVLAETEVGQFYGFWSEAAIRRKVETEVAKFPLKNNDLGSGMLLQGKFATINLHPAAAKEFKGINFPLKKSVNHLVSWNNVDGTWEAKPVSGLYGKTITSEEELLQRLPQRLPDHDPVSYINSGFDEVQVYYGVTVLMEALNEMGFEDKELSTKPFHAFLYDPDISMQDNAYYTDNTINFTTYSSGQPNMARDNPTVWHELGHGVMDRLMGAHLVFADTKAGYGGLSEGMADFVAKIVVEHQTSGAEFPGKQDFRIINNTGFYLTNEFHDEGEAYGGVMNDMLDVVIKREGREGLYDFTDLTLETMRLTRNHPALTARLWIEAMLYADELGSEVRTAGQYKNIILKALEKRNFGFGDFKEAKMTVTFEQGELTNVSPASREKPLTECGVDGVVAHDLKVALTAGDSNFIKFPATVKVEFKKGALQGAIKWEGEEANPTSYTINTAEEVLNVPLRASMECDAVNQPDGSCKDYAYLQVFNQGETKPIAKKRFYLKLNKANCKK